MSTDTEALRALADDMHGYRTPVDTITAAQDALRQAADDLDNQRTTLDEDMKYQRRLESWYARLREAVEAAPHEPLCFADKGLLFTKECTCWKSEALKIGETDHE